MPLCIIGGGDFNSYVLKYDLFQNEDYIRILWSHAMQRHR